MTANELEVLEHYKRKIVKYIDAPEVLLKCLGKLDQVRVNIDLLGVGFNVIHIVTWLLCTSFRGQVLE